SFISPNEDIREQVGEIIGKDRFHMIHMDASLEFCKQNKPELYELAEKGKLEDLPGVHVPFEKPEKPDVVCKPEDNGKNPEQIIEYLNLNKIFPV
ncbi:MAG: adenylyl-sulfate kinase, partial [Prolixibacteraceae bacterium]|nr:adenylyl-sulfate kinase [Prolixibacteraceae bacterium]